MAFPGAPRRVLRGVDGDLAPLWRAALVVLALAAASIVALALAAGGAREDVRSSLLHLGFAVVIAAAFVGVSWWRRARPLPSTLGRRGPFAVAGGLAALAAAALLFAVDSLVARAATHAVGQAFAVAGLAAVVFGGAAWAMAAGRGNGPTG